jgi:hypothetical protein
MVYGVVTLSTSCLVTIVVSLSSMLDFYKKKLRFTAAGLSNCKA